ncbi:MAG: NAD-dependent epimerase/dehydratase family protein [Agriterribacter sp.]
MKKVLVTGATGFIGNYVVQRLLKEGHTVIASSSQKTIAENKNWFLNVVYRPLNFQSLDDTVNYYNFFEKPDLIIHLAWEGLPNYKSDFHITENLPKHRLFLNNLIRNGLPDITVTGTCFEYGMREGCLREDMPAAPANPYAQAKNELRKFLESLQTTYSFHFKWLRLFYMYGEGQNPKSLLSQLETAVARGDSVFNMSGGEQTRDFLPVETMADYIVQVATQTKVTGIINGCSGIPVTVKKLVKNYLEKHEKHVTLNLGYYPYPDYEPMHFWGDITRLNKIINKAK